jgi:hypothetical protein
MAKTTVSAFLKAGEEAMAAHHKRMAKLAKDDGDAHRQAEHEDMAEHHAQRAEKCDEGMATKAAGMNGDAIVPDRVSGVISHFPVKPVPRYGSPALSKADVAPEFAKLVEIEDD